MAYFLEQAKSECHFTNQKKQVRFEQRFVYNQEEYVRFDSDVWEFEAVTALGQPDVQYWNSQKEILNNSHLCSYLSSSLTLSAFSLLVEPVVTVYLAKTQPLQHHSLLVCSVNGFYPGHIEVRWFRNGQEEEAGVASTGLIQNGDWTFQILVMLETTPQSGEVYSCQVEHPRLTSPVTVEWKAQSGSVQSKMLNGIGGLVLGLLFLGVGLFIHFRNQKGKAPGGS
nr:DLA class II histocompatibility antigen, DR-1 beta chain-like [Loxodonta africana]